LGPSLQLGATSKGFGEVAVKGIAIPPLEGTVNPDGTRVDIWGVEYTATDSTDGLTLPLRQILLKDITKWREVIKAPNVDDVDWKAVADKSCNGIDRGQYAVTLLSGGAFFMELMNLMGFTEG
jgi:hypothetical protein